MAHDLIIKKLEQMATLLKELEGLLALPFAEFKNQFTNVRAAERNFQLIVELASDINAHIVAELGAQVPETYRESFTRMAERKILNEDHLQEFIKSSNLRNILTHEYDFDEDNFIFYASAKKFIPLYQQYIQSVQYYLAAEKEK